MFLIQDFEAKQRKSKYLSPLNTHGHIYMKKTVLLKDLKFYG